MKVLFVCLGNICRSPTAEAIFRKKFSELKIKAHFDSAATSNFHIGDQSDPRSISHAERRGYEMTHLGRQVCADDFNEFDFIFAMDESNLKNLLSISPKEHAHKISLLTKYAKNKSYKYVPDPYYGKAEDFELVIDIIEDCVDNFVQNHRLKFKAQ